ncbi:MAG: single-stranded DNA-binding protein [Nitrospiria bacterium]
MAESQAFGVNKVFLIGRLGRDPKLRETRKGTQVCNFSIATSESVKGRDGKYEERTEWHRVVAWAKLARACAKYLKSGSRVFVEGKLQASEWEDKQGGKHKSVDVVAWRVEFLGGGSSGEDGEAHEERTQDIDEEVPF